MKKTIFAIAMAIVMVFAASCGNNRTESVVEEEVVDAVDSTAVAVDSLAVDSLQVAE